MTLVRTALALLALRMACLAQGGACTELHSLVQTTYNFKPSHLSTAERKDKSAEMDKVWNLVQSKPAEMVPCLMAEMERAGADGWFLYDAASLLAPLEHSARANQLLLRSCEAVDLDDVALLEWVRRLTTLALEDVDISTAAARWMTYDHATFSEPAHAFQAKRPEGAFFLYGSMNEAQAVPALLKIAANPAHPERELALSLLANLATPEADAAFRSVDLSGFSPEVQTAAKAALAGRPVFERREPPKSTRQEFLAVLKAAAEQRDFRPFGELSTRVPDGERDMVTVLVPGDLPLIRKARRAMAASTNPDLMDDYPYFTGIIMTLQRGR